MKKEHLILILFFMFVIILYSSFYFVKKSVQDTTLKKTEKTKNTDIYDYHPKTNEEEIINLSHESNDNSKYSFIYNGEEFFAEYTDEHWTIYNSYKITNKNDILKICKALLEEHPIHGADMKSYRTPEDVAYEWEQHNIAYMCLSENSEWKARTADLDITPEDQDMSLKELFESRTGEEFNSETIKKYMK